MDLAETLFFMMQKNAQAMQLTDLVVGTVTSAAPLEISINAAMAPLKAPVLLLTESVVEKKIPVLAHAHDVPPGTLMHTHSNTAGITTDALSASYSTDTRLASIACVEHGATLPVESGYIILNRALAAGDKVLLLRVQHGQKFIVLSRIFE